MPSRSEITYFGAGPALLPTDVLESAAQALLNYQDTGLGIAEHSHRSEFASRIVNEAKADLASFLDLPPDEYEALFMSSGGTGQFSATVYNMVGTWVKRERAAILRERGLKEDGDDDGDEASDVVAELQKRVRDKLRIDYIITGTWSLKAYQEAVRLLGYEFVNVAADARHDSPEGKFGTVPDPSTWRLSADPAMVYYCDNETVDGVEFPASATAAIAARMAASSLSPSVVVADMSSNILSRRFDPRNFGIFFFGAQKNLGSAGITVAVVRREFLPPIRWQPKPDLLRQLNLPIPPIMFSYEVIFKNNSLYNTLSIFDTNIAGQVLKKLLRTFPDKIDGQEKVANQKAELLYAALDAHPDVYRVVPHKDVRSRMNICFRVTKNGNMDEAEKAFLKEATSLGLTGLKGHRSVGGLRASNYNSITLEGAEKLAKFIDDFARA